MKKFKTHADLIHQKDQKERGKFLPNKDCIPLLLRVQLIQMTVKLTSEKYKQKETCPFFFHQSVSKANKKQIRVG